MKSKLFEINEFEKEFSSSGSSQEDKDELTKFEDELKDLQNAKELLMNSKLGLQNELEDANSRTNILKQEIEKVKGVSRKVEDRLQSELSQLKTELVRM